MIPRGGFGGDSPWSSMPARPLVLALCFVFTVVLTPSHAAPSPSILLAPVPVTGIEANLKPGHPFYNFCSDKKGADGDYSAPGEKCQNRFIKCTAGSPTVHYCSHDAPLYFDPSRDLCDEIDNIPQCGGKLPQWFIDSNGVKCEANIEVRFIESAPCSQRYVVCRRGVKTPDACDPGLVLDAAVQRCRPIENVLGCAPGSNSNRSPTQSAGYFQSAPHGPAPAAAQSAQYGQQTPPQQVPRNTGYEGQAQQTRAQPQPRAQTGARVLLRQTNTQPGALPQSLAQTGQPQPQAAGYGQPPRTQQRPLGTSGQTLNPCNGVTGFVVAPLPGGRAECENRFLACQGGQVVTLTCENQREEFNPATGSCQPWHFTCDQLLAPSVPSVPAPAPQPQPEPQATSRGATRDQRPALTPYPGLPAQEVAPVAPTGTRFCEVNGSYREKRTTSPCSPLYVQCHDRVATHSQCPQGFAFSQSHIECREKASLQECSFSHAEPHGDTMTCPPTGNGNFTIALCSRDYVECLAGVSHKRSCPTPDHVFDHVAMNCTPKAKATDCQEHEVVLEKVKKTNGACKNGTGDYPLGLCLPEFRRCINGSAPARVACPNGTLFGNGACHPEAMLKGCSKKTEKSGALALQTRENHFGHNPADFCSRRQDGTYAWGSCLKAFACCRSNELSLFSCPDGEVFDIFQVRCVQESICNPSTPQEIEPQHEPCLSEPGPNALIGQCVEVYYSCNDARSAFTQCSRGFVYDSTLNHCVARDSCARTASPARAHPLPIGPATPGLAVYGQGHRTQIRAPVPSSVDVDRVTCSDLPDGVYPLHRGACTPHYYVCLQGTPVHYTCQRPNTLFDSVAVHCVSERVCRRDMQFDPAGTLTNHCVDKRHGHALHLDFCINVYMVCNGYNNQMVPATCGNHRVYDALTNSCVEPARCHSGIGQAPVTGGPYNPVCAKLADGVYPTGVCVDKFFFCSQGQFLQTTCPQGEVWDQFRMKCDAPELCTRLRPAQQLPQANPCAGQSDGSYPMGRCIHAFLRCEAGRPTFVECQRRGYAYEVRVHSCVPMQICEQTDLAIDSAFTNFQQRPASGAAAFPTDRVPFPTQGLPSQGYPRRQAFPFMFGPRFQQFFAAPQTSYGQPTSYAQQQPIFRAPGGYQQQQLAPVPEPQPAPHYPPVTPAQKPPTLPPGPPLPPTKPATHELCTGRKAGTIFGQQCGRFYFKCLDGQLHNLLCPYEHHLFDNILEVCVPFFQCTPGYGAFPGDGKGLFVDHPPKYAGGPPYGYFALHGGLGNQFPAPDFTGLFGGGFGGPGFGNGAGFGGAGFGGNAFGDGVGNGFGGAGFANQGFGNGFVNPGVGFGNGVAPGAGFQAGGVAGPAAAGIAPGQAGPAAQQDFVDVPTESYQQKPKPTIPPIYGLGVVGNYGKAVGNVGSYQGRSLNLLPGFHGPYGVFHPPGYLVPPFGPVTPRPAAPITPAYGQPQPAPYGPQPNGVFPQQPFEFQGQQPFAGGGAPHIAHHGGVPNFGQAIHTGITPYGTTVGDVEPTLTGSDHPWNNLNQPSAFKGAPILKKAGAATDAHKDGPQPGGLPGQSHGKGPGVVAEIHERKDQKIVVPKPAPKPTGYPTGQPGPVTGPGQPGPQLVGGQQIDPRSQFVNQVGPQNPAAFGQNPGFGQIQPGFAQQPAFFNQGGRPNLIPNPNQFAQGRFQNQPNQFAPGQFPNQQFAQNFAPGRQGFTQPGFQGNPFQPAAGAPGQFPRPGFGPQGQPGFGGFQQPGGFGAQSQFQPGAAQFQTAPGQQFLPGAVGGQFQTAPGVFQPGADQFPTGFPNQQPGGFQQGVPQGFGNGFIRGARKKRSASYAPVLKVKKPVKKAAVFGVHGLPTQFAGHSVGNAFANPFTFQSPSVDGFVKTTGNQGFAFNPYAIYGFQSGIPYPGAELGLATGGLGGQGYAYPYGSFSKGVYGGGLGFHADVGLDHPAYPHGSGAQALYKFGPYGGFGSGFNSFPGYFGSAGLGGFGGAGFGGFGGAGFGHGIGGFGGAGFGHGVGFGGGFGHGIGAGFGHGIGAGFGHGVGFGGGFGHGFGGGFGHGFGGGFGGYGGGFGLGGFGAGAGHDTAFGGTSSYGSRAHGYSAWPYLDYGAYDLRPGIKPRNDYPWNKRIHNYNNDFNTPALRLAGATGHGFGQYSSTAGHFGPYGPFELNLPTTGFPAGPFHHITSQIQTNPNLVDTKDKVAGAGAGAAGVPVVTGGNEIFAQMQKVSEGQAKVKVLAKVDAMHKVVGAIQAEDPTTTSTPSPSGQSSSATSSTAAASQPRAATTSSAAPTPSTSTAPPVTGPVNAGKTTPEDDDIIYPTP